MNKENILAHRGLWYRNEEKNSSIAISRALEAGFGIETDLRDSCGEIIISHDPVPDEYEMNVNDLLKLLKQFNWNSRIALNIKADGLHKILKDEVFKEDQAFLRAYVFDMSVPDMFGYIETEIPVYCRVSEYEVMMHDKTEVQGVWVDNFGGNYPQLEKAMSFLDMGFRVGLVSPELHGRPHENIWRGIRSIGLHHDSNFELCTDFPEDAFDFFAGNV